MKKTVLIIGSAPDALRARAFDVEKVQAIVAINNAWQVRSDWSHLIHPEDLPDDRLPPSSDGRETVTYRDYVPANNEFGGIVYAGGTMAFTAAYWALSALKPDIMAFIGCDMIYEGDPEKSHFYGRGEPDPLRADPTLQSLEAKSERLRWYASSQGCWCTNVSSKDHSRLTFDRLDAALLSQDLSSHHEVAMRQLEAGASKAAIARSAETAAACYVDSGDYWNAMEKIDAEKLRAIDQLWLQVFKSEVFRPRGGG